MRWVNQNINGSRYIGFHRKGSNRLLGIKITKVSDHDFEPMLPDIDEVIKDLWDPVVIPESLVAISGMSYYEESDLSYISAPKLTHMDII